MDLLLKPNTRKKLKFCRFIFYFRHFAVCLLCLNFSQLVCAKSLKVVFGTNKPPFVMEESVTGLEIDLVREVFHSMGHELEADAVPFARLTNIWKDVPDLAAVAVVAKEPDSGLFYVDNFVYYETVAFTRAGSGIEINSVDDLVGHKLATFPSAHLYLGDNFYQHFNPDNGGKHLKYYKEFPSNWGSVAVFWLNHYDVVVGDKTIFYWFTEKLKDKMNTSGMVSIHPVFGGKFYYPIAFKDKALADSFAKGLAQIKASGVYQQIYAKYINYDSVRVGD